MLMQLFHKPTFFRKKKWYGYRSQISWANNTILQMCNLANLNHMPRPTFRCLHAVQKVVEGLK